MYYVYILISMLNDQIYIGSTNDLKKRIEEHNDGKSISTKRYKPWILHYYEAYRTEHLARMRERNLKYHGNAIKELKKRIGLLKSGAGVYPAPEKSGAGFTLIELLIVIGITTILLSLSTINLVRVQQKTNLTAVVDTLIADLKSQQIKAMKGDSGGGDFGIHFTGSNSYILTPDNFTVNLDNPIQISSFPGNDIVFTQISGEVANAPNTITLTNSAGGDQQIIDINKYGVITNVN